MDAINCYAKHLFNFKDDLAKSQNVTRSFLWSDPLDLTLNRLDPNRPTVTYENVQWTRLKQPNRVLLADPPASPTKSDFSY